MQAKLTGNPQEDLADIQFEPFWKTKSLREMNRWEWELICDGCGICCLHKFQEENNSAVHYTNVSCHLFCTETCRCTSYHNRHHLVPTCMILNPTRVEEYYWLPETCAYRLLAQGKDLPWWHHLVSGDPDLIHRLGLSAKGNAVSEKNIHPLQLKQQIMEWASELSKK